MKNGSLKRLTLQTSAPAKLNLSLEINQELLPNGYHEVLSLMQMLDFADHLSLTVLAGKGEELSLSFGADFNQKAAVENYRHSLKSDNNLLLLASRAYFQAQGKKPPFALCWKLEKRIPLGSGMGGGSSNAAAALRLLNEAVRHLPESFNLRPLSTESLLALARTLGADPSFFLVSSTCLAEGYGERLTALKPFEAFSVLLFLDEKHLGTYEAFKQLDSLRPTKSTPFSNRDKLLKKLKQSSSLLEIQEFLRNDFSILHQDRLNEIRAELKNFKADFIGLTGTGPTVFALFTERHQRDEALKKLAKKNKFVLRSTSFLNELPTIQLLDSETFS